MSWVTRCATQRGDDCRAGDGIQSARQPSLRNLTRHALLSPRETQQRTVVARGVGRGCAARHEEEGVPLMSDRLAPSARLAPRVCRRRCGWQQDASAVGWMGPSRSRRSSSPVSRCSIFRRAPRRSLGRSVAPPSSATTRSTCASSSNVRWGSAWPAISLAGGPRFLGGRA
jgi:hypothetical protein